MLLYSLTCLKSSVALSPWSSMIAFSTAWLIILNTGMNFDLVLWKCFISANSFVCKNASRVERVAGVHLLISVFRRTAFKVVSRLGVCLCSTEAISALSEQFCHFIKSFQKRRNWFLYYWNHFAWGHEVQFSLNGWFTFFLLDLCVMTLTVLPEKLCLQQHPRFTQLLLVVPNSWGKTLHLFFWWFYCIQGTLTSTFCPLPMWDDVGSSLLLTWPLEQYVYWKKCLFFMI